MLQMKITKTRFAGDVGIIENDWFYRGPRKGAIRIARVQRSKYIGKTLLVLMQFAEDGCGDPAICLYKT